MRIIKPQLGDCPIIKSNQITKHLICESFTMTKHYVYEVNNYILVYIILRSYLGELLS
jgi:hypothetical protein